MIIIFNGDTLALLQRLQQFSGKSQKITLDFMLENFRIPTTENGSEENNLPPHPFAPNIYVEPILCDQH